FCLAENTDDLFVGKSLLHGDVLMWLMKTLLTSRCINQRGAGHARQICARKPFSESFSRDVKRVLPERLSKHQRTISAQKLCWAEYPGVRSNSMINLTEI
ncbi:hypothetical protein CG434_13240, partial [Pantoea ananatis]